MAYLLGIDLGTSSVKAVLVDREGQMLGIGSAEYPVLMPRPDYAEQDPEMWWQATGMAVRQAVAAVQPDAIAAIALSGQTHGTVLLDAAERLLAPAIIWLDRRSRAQVREITECIGATRLIEITGSPVATGFQAATLRWVQQEQPEVWRQVRHILLPKDYLRWRMVGGPFSTDPSDAAGTLLLDVRTRSWSPVLLEALGVDVMQLPEVRPSTATDGALTRQAAEHLGLRPGIPVVVGAADTPNSALAGGVVSPEALLLT
ncbi:MAG: FGGY family carbohydrate kinase, partial [Anaerolineae bacterium]|nr:FGGY family carbohydrate kinase [Anaerolineae bacterium]